MIPLVAVAMLDSFGTAHAASPLGVCGDTATTPLRAARPLLGHGSTLRGTEQACFTLDLLLPHYLLEHDFGGSVSDRRLATVGHIERWRWSGPPRAPKCLRSRRSTPARPRSAYRPLRKPASSLRQGSPNGASRSVPKPALEGSREGSRARSICDAVPYARAGVYRGFGAPGGRGVLSFGSYRPDPPQSS